MGNVILNQLIELLVIDGTIRQKRRYNRYS